MFFKLGGKIPVLKAAGVTCSKWTINMIEVLWNMFKANSKDTRTKPIDAVAVSFGVN